MITLFDHETIQEFFLAEVREDAREELRAELTEAFNKREAELKENAEKAAEKAAEETAEKTRLEDAKEFATNLLSETELSLDSIAKYSRLPLPQVEELAKNIRNQS